VNLVSAQWKRRDVSEIRSRTFGDFRIPNGCQYYPDRRPVLQKLRHAVAYHGVSRCPSCASLLLTVDEFQTRGRLGMFAKSLSLIGGISSRLITQKPYADPSALAAIIARCKTKLHKHRSL
jgi:hypothetical protein